MVIATDSRCITWALGVPAPGRHGVSHGSGENGDGFSEPAEHNSVVLLAVS